MHMCKEVRKCYPLPSLLQMKKLRQNETVWLLPKYSPPSFQCMVRSLQPLALSRSEKQELLVLILFYQNQIAWILNRFVCLRSGAHADSNQRPVNIHASWKCLEHPLHFISEVDLGWTHLDKCLHIHLQLRMVTTDLFFSTAVRISMLLQFVWFILDGLDLNVKNTG